MTSMTLEQGLAKLGMSLSERQQEQLLEHAALIQKWNKVYNLTAVRDPAEILTHHLLDSLAAIAPLQRQLHSIAAAGNSGEAMLRLLDVGSGAGLPGVVIAICCPNIQVDCVDTVSKKATFIQQVALQLKLPNLRGIHARVESLNGPYEVITSRAFASLVDFTRWSGGALGDGGVWMALKGKHPQEEIGGLDPNTEVFHVEQLAVPGLEAERCIIWMRKKAAD